MAKRAKLRVFISTSIYGHEERIEQVVGTIKAHGFEPVVSNRGDVYPDPFQDNLESCLGELERCDCFVGHLTCRYGTSKLQNGESITHREMRHAVDLGMPRWFFVEQVLKIARLVLKPYRESGGPGFLSSSIIKDEGALLLYEEIALASTPEVEGVPGRWVQEFRDTTELLRQLQTLFKHKEQIWNTVDEYKQTQR